MSGWTQDEAVDLWLADLEAEEASRQAARRRLDEAPIDPDDPREVATREAAVRWLDRGQGRVALALLDRSVMPPRPTEVHTALGRAAGLAAELDVLLAGRPGTAGLPALTADEMSAVKAAETPEEALEVLRQARSRLEAHGAEAKRLLRSWVERQK